MAEPTVGIELLPMDPNLLRELQAATKAARKVDPDVFTVLNVLYGAVIIGQIAGLAACCKDWIQRATAE